MRSSPQTDVAIAGGGAAGCLMAAKLAASGRRVTVLEAGPAWSTADLWSSQLWARRLKWRGPPVTVGGANPIAHNVIMGSGLGGAALHHYGTWPRFTADVFDVAARSGEGRDWPFSYDVLRPYYDRIQREVGLAGDAAAEPWRAPGDPYPLPPLRTFRHGELLREGFQKLHLAVAPLPAAIASAPYAGRPACLYDGWCDAGCPTGALGNPLVTYYPRALEHGALFRTGCQVTRVVTDRAGRARGLEYVCNGERSELNAGQIVLAASVVENVRLLLNSSSSRHPHGLGNGSGLVGRHVMAEVMAFAYGLFPVATENYLGVSAGQLLHRGPVHHSELPDITGGFQWQIAPTVKPNDLFGIACTRPQLYGQALHEFMGRASRGLACMVGFGGGVPAPENAILLDTQRDHFGMPRARVRHQFTAKQLRLWKFMNAQGDAVMRAAGATESWSGRMGAGHLIGGTIMGHDPARSVTDSAGALHEVPNLYIAGAGLFPASGGMSPTFTLHAMALRTAERMQQG